MISRVLIGAIIAGSVFAAIGFTLSALMFAALAKRYQQLHPEDEIKLEE